MRMERAEGEAMRVERESEAECVAQEQVIDSICCMLCIFSSGMRDSVLPVIGTHTA